MSDKKKQNIYKNIDSDTYVFDDSNSESKSNIKQQHTLDFYNDEMPRKAVKGIFNINNENTDSDEKKQSKKTYGYDGTDRHNIVNKPEKIKKPAKKEVVEYTEQSFDYDKLNNEVNEASTGYRYGSNKAEDFNYKNTVFSQEKIEEERKARAMVEKNKEILRSLEEEPSLTERVKSISPYKTVQELQESKQTANNKKRINQQALNKRKQVMYVRFCTSIFIIIILLILCINIFTKSKLKKEVATLTAENARLLAENSDVQKYITEIKILEGEIAQLKATTGNTEQNNETGTNGEVDANNNQGENQSQGVNEHTVGNGETLSSISYKYYSDPNKYNVIVEANNLSSTDVFPGQKLIIP